MLALLLTVLSICVFGVVVVVVVSAVVIKSSDTRRNRVAMRVRREQRG